MTFEADELIQRHRSRGILIDTNLLVLYLVGATNRGRIRNFKRTQSYTNEDFDLLRRLVGMFSKVITTPHVLTEVSNLTDLPGQERKVIRTLFRLQVSVMEECFDESRVVVNDSEFDSLGLTDAALVALESRNLLVLTDDANLYLALNRRGIDTLNFNHIRALKWD